MDESTLAVPEPAPPAPRPHDPLAVALGNASLLGVGYLLLRRRGLAVLAVAVTVVLVSLLVSTADPAYEVAMLVWWAAVIAHGWFLARGEAGRDGGRGAVRGQRLVALGVTLPVLLAVGLLRFDASRVGESVAGARERGDCAKVVSAQDGVWFGHRMADAPLAARGDEIVEDCYRLDAAGGQLTTGLTGDTASLQGGFETLASVLAQPGNEKTVETTLTRFLRGLPAEDPCATVAVTDWLRERKRSHDVLDRSAATARRTAPAALVACGDDLMGRSDWTAAQAHYKRLLDQYPGDGLTAKARAGVKKATLSIELANVRNLLAPGTGAQPAYCSKPAKYSGAKPLRKGINRALFYGGETYGDDHADKLPGSWKAAGATDAVLVVCMGEDTFGNSVQTCPYRPRGSGSTTYVTFRKVAVPVKVYELRTGKLVSHRTLQIGGSSCPAVITYYSGSSGPGPASNRYVSASTSDVRSAFRPLVDR
ncbi:hypothetical protein [Streptomyces melanosporofaciens]|uniref:Uncharacterized protein n=1 Tax=Streptomyces melanosporofaciens TaxID=67327 RepID=A0A1H4V0G7_STRMJ|nr:hypothetical protein [Streptomyces melanosporofaciens]SEC73961.1 hypothetical protein SAMN04490356_5331 [Streptomyces melanosporofaciens]